MEFKNEFNLLANLIIDSLKSESFRTAWLNIEMASDVIAMDGEYIDLSGNKKNMEVESEIQHFKAVRNIKEITQSHPLQHARWNRAKFTISSDGKFNMEYVWDQSLQDEVEKYRSSS
jgi:hypothetical protein